MSFNDPMDQFFSEVEQAESPYILYTALGISLPTADKSEREAVSQEDVRRAYRKAAIRCHPDKHATKSEEEKKRLADEFQKVGFAYAVLSDEKRKARYDATGRTSEVSFDDMGEGMEWATYFETVFTKVDKKMLDEDRKRYQGSEEETEDVLEAYRTSSGDLDGIMSRIPHSTTKDEARFITLIESSIESGLVERLARWTKTSGSVKGKRRRAKVEAGEAKEAEEHAKVLGIWEEMYGDAQKAAGSGSGKDAEVKGKSGKRSRTGEPTSAGDEGEDDLSGLAAMIAKRQGSRESAMNALFEKYSRPPPVKRSKKK